MHIAVTGGAGFIGSHLCEQLLRHGHSVVIIDDLNDFYSSTLKQQNLRAVEATGPIGFHRLDICDTEALLKVLGPRRPDTVIHLAARAGVRPSLAQPFLYERTNVFGTLSVLEVCRHLKIPKILFASSSSIYGIAKQVPFREDDSLNLPVSVYAATKIAGEKLCYTYSHLYNISAVCLRFFTVYGPRQRPDLAIRRFVECIDAGEEIPIFGDGTTGRDYTYIADTIQGILSALDYKTRFDVFNLGNSEPISLSSMVSTIERALGKKAKIRRLPEQPGDVPITCADISKARALLGYSPGTPFETGIERFVAWHRNCAPSHLT